MRAPGEAPGREDRIQAGTEQDQGRRGHGRARALFASPALCDKLVSRLPLIGGLGNDRLLTRKVALSDVVGNYQRIKDGKEHHYWSLVENRRVDGGRQRAVRHPHQHSQRGCDDANAGVKLAPLGIVRRCPRAGQTEGRGTQQHQAQRGQQPAPS